MLGLSGETLQGMSLDSRSLCNYGKSLCGNGKPSGKFEPQKFNPKPRVKKKIETIGYVMKGLFLK
jgi:hypothetical protein